MYTDSDLSRSDRKGDIPRLRPDALFVPRVMRVFRGFSTPGYAEQFLSGKIYMNTLGYFYWHGNGAQRDPLEGAGASVHPGAFTNLPPSLITSQNYNVQVRPEGFRYCNVCCLSMQIAQYVNAGYGVALESPHPSVELGDALVVIDDIRVFLDRVIAACNNLGYRVVIGPVAYREVECLAGPGGSRHGLLFVNEESAPYDFYTSNPAPVFDLDAFVKTHQYQVQMEWRIALYRGEKSIDAYTLDVGSLRDIAHVVHRRMLNVDGVQAIQRRTPWLPMPTGYFGNATRQELADLFFELGEREVTLALSVG